MRRKNGLSLPLIANHPGHVWILYLSVAKAWTGGDKREERGGAELGALL